MAKPQSPPANELISIASSDANVCEAARAITGKRFFASHAPALPLESCDQRGCQCKYERTDLQTEVTTHTPPIRQRQSVREGERHKTWFRSGRLNRIEGVWFICTREGIEVGPFDSEIEAKKHEKRLIELLKPTNTAEEAYQIIREYQQRPAAIFGRQASSRR